MTLTQRTMTNAALAAAVTLAVTHLGAHVQTPMPTHTSTPMPMPMPMPMPIPMPTQTPAPTQAPASPVMLTKVAVPEKALKFEVVVPASVDDVWTAFTTKAGLQTWLWRDCAVDLRVGGDWTANFGVSTGGGTIKSFTPRREVVMAALAPEKFPTVRRERTTAVFAFEAVTPKSTRVTLTQTGWQSGAEWDAAYDYLATGNAQLLMQLYTRFLKGPLDWSKGQ
jgi:uncharacterized protein YndB with AHSA1/START domain